MDRGTYAAASSGLFHLRKLEVINNNLANANTAGFKRQLLIGEKQSFEETLASLVKGQDPYAKGDHDRTPGVTHIEAVTDFSQGSIKPTSNPFDVALRNAKDFFVVNGPSGLQYTRAGNFTLNSQSEISTLDGAQVQGDGGAIVASGPNVRITPSGKVTSNGEVVGTLQVVRIEDPSKLVREGNARFSAPPGSPQPISIEPELEPESLEMANISMVSAMVELITATRGFEMYTRGARTADDLNQLVISQVGRSG